MEKEQTEWTGSSAQTEEAFFARSHTTGDESPVFLLDPHVVEDAADEAGNGEALRQDPAPHHDLRHVRPLFGEETKPRYQAQSGQPAACNEEKYAC